MSSAATVREEFYVGPGSPVASKLGAFARLSNDDLAGLVEVARNSRLFDARRDLISEGDRASSVHLMLDGWACRYKELPDGKRQILSIFVPGDFCDLDAYILRAMDHSIGALTRVRAAIISREEIDALTRERPRLAQALWWSELVNAGIQREWTLNLGLRTASERLAHLLIELYLRLKTVGQASGNRCDFPLTQGDLADATGLTSVHVNRTLQELRHDGLIELERRQLQILDMPRLMSTAMFNPNYLHLDHEGRHLDAIG